MDNAASVVMDPLISDLISRETSKVQTNNENINGRYLNTSLPIIPDIRNLIIQENTHDLFLSLFNIRTRRSKTGEGNKKILQGGPNGRRNRYLRYQYDRML
jgi:hypothetical protein